MRGRRAGFALLITSPSSRSGGVQSPAAAPAFVKYMNCQTLAADRGFIDAMRRWSIAAQQHFATICCAAKRGSLEVGVPKSCRSRRKGSHLASAKGSG
jgi:hypothetical protein